MDSKIKEIKGLSKKNIDVIPRKLAVIYGGVSEEKDICNLEGKLMIKFFEKYGHSVYPIKIDKTNSFFKRLEKSPKFAILCLTEDLGIQWVLDLYGIKYNGSGPFSTTLSLDKTIVKQLISDVGIKTPAFQEIIKGEGIDNILWKNLVFPLVVKPSRCGSSHGISLVRSKVELQNALEKAFKDDSRVVLEQFIKGVEITVVCLGQTILGVVEIDKGKALIYNYETKLNGQVQCYEPARISKSAFKSVDEMIKKVIAVLGVRNLFRVDAIVKGDDVFFLEINTLPFMAEGGEPIEAVKNKGWNMYDFIEEVVIDALNYKPKRVLG